MEVILLEKVANLGNLGDKVNIKGGYARNFLLPQGKATVATAENVAALKPAAPSWKRLPPRRRPLPKPVLPSSPSWW